MPQKAKAISKARVIDLFSGIGGLTHGFVREGFDVVAGIDIDEGCRYGFEINNNSKFICKDIANVTPQELKQLFGNGGIKILVGCAPCQPFSTLNSDRAMYKSRDVKWQSIDYFSKLIKKIKPEIVSMENVRELSDGEKFPVFNRFIRTLKSNGYNISYRVLDASKYGVPQKRIRLVLLASRLGPISLIPETHIAGSLATVQHAIGNLPPIRDGWVNTSDPLHRASKLSKLNKERIMATPKNGGSATDWKKSLLPKSYRSKNTYKSTVYGRMRWNEPAPTMTTHCTTLGTGRYGHPSQNRAISLREAARIQTFPDSYKFEPNDKFSITRTSKYIGNAVPVRLGQVIAKSIKHHIDLYQ